MNSQSRRGWVEGFLSNALAERKDTLAHTLVFQWNLHWPLYQLQLSPPSNILTRVIKCFGDRADWISQNSRKKQELEHLNLTGVVHRMASQAPEWWTPCIRSEIMPTGQHLKLTDRKFSTSPYDISERTQYIRSATLWKSVVLSSLPTYWDSPLCKWRTV